MFKRLHLSNVDLKKVMELEKIFNTYNQTKNTNLKKVLNDKIEEFKMDIEFMFLTGYPENFYNILKKELINIEANIND